MDFDDLFAELEAKFEALQLRQRASASQDQQNTLVITLHRQLALPNLRPKQDFTLVHASVGSDCIAGFDASLDFLIALRLASIAELGFGSSRIDVLQTPTQGDFSFDSLVRGLELPREVWLSREGEQRQQRVQLTAVDSGLLRLGFGQFARFVPLAAVEAIAVSLSAADCG